MGFRKTKKDLRGPKTVHREESPMEMRERMQEQIESVLISKDSLDFGHRIVLGGVEVKQDNAGVRCKWRSG